MNNNIVDRIKAFMQYKSLNSLSLSKELGYNSSEKYLGFSETKRPNLLMI